MQLSVLLFGITKDVVGQRKISLELDSGQNVAGLMIRLRNDFPKLKEVSSLLIAVNEEYAKDDRILLESDEIALIPPVSGG